MREKIHLLIFLLGFLIPFSLFSQNENSNDNNEQIKTLTDNNKRSNGGYGGFSIGYTRIDNHYNGAIIGGKGAWIINHCFGIGGAGYGYANYNSPNVNFFKVIAGGYGGLLLEPIFWGTHVVNLSIPLIIGAGGISTITDNDFYGIGYFIFAPGAELQFTISYHFRLALGFDYRITYNFNNSWGNDLILSSDASRGFSVRLGFKFGKF
jgi:hypothetical protein